LLLYCSGIGSLTAGMVGAGFYAAPRARIDTIAALLLE